MRKIEDIKERIIEHDRLIQSSEECGDIKAADFYKKCRGELETEFRAAITDGIPLSDLEPACAAIRARTFVVLPKRGEKLFYAPYQRGQKDLNGEPMYLRNNDDGTGVVEAVRVHVRFNNWMGWVPPHKTFKTREAAEAAQKEGE